MSFIFLSGLSGGLRDEISHVLLSCAIPCTAVLAVLQLARVFSKRPFVAVLCLLPPSVCCRQVCGSERRFSLRCMFLTTQEDLSEKLVDYHVDMLLAFAAPRF